MGLARIVVISVVVLSDSCGRGKFHSPRWWAKLSSVKKTKAYIVYNLVQYVYSTYMAHKFYLDIIRLHYTWNSWSKLLEYCRVLLV